MGDPEFIQKFIWSTGYTHITDSYISVAKSVIHDRDMQVRPKDYNVFTKTRLYEELSNIETVDQVKAFVISYGVLGIEIERKETELQNIVDSLTRSFNTKDLETYKKITLALQEMKKALYFEHTNDFLQEAKIMRELLKLNSYHQIKVSEIQDVRTIMNKITDLCEIEFSYTIDKPIADFKLLEHASKALITVIVNKKMENVSKALGMEYTESEKGFIYFDSWQPKTLLGCLYTMLYIDLIGGAKTAVCKYCFKPFVVLDNRNKERHDACRTAYHTQLSRKRKRLAIDLYKNGLTVQQIYKQLNEGEKNTYSKEIKIEQIKKWIGVK